MQAMAVISVSQGIAMIGFLPARKIATTRLVRDAQPQMAVGATTLESTAAKALLDVLYRVA